MTNELCKSRLKKGEFKREDILMYRESDATMNYTSGDEFDFILE